MKIVNDTQIVRTYWESGLVGRQEFEISVAYNVEELHQGTNDTDDPSECVINERVKVLEDVGPFKIGDMLLLSDEERENIEQEELQNQIC